MKNLRLNGLIPLKTFVEFPFFTKVRDEMSKIKKEFSKIASESASKLRLETNLDALQEYILTDCLDIIDGSTKSKFELIKKCHDRFIDKISKITKTEA
jgi:hypothetical protein